MSLKKFKAIWPLPRGMRDYVLTLREILEKITEENPRIDHLVLWFKNKYNWSNGPARYGLRVVNKCLGFIQEIGGRLKLTPVAEEFLRTGENRLILDALRRRVLGFDEILSMLAEGQRLSLTEIHKELLERCNLNWKTTIQTMYRLNWLISLGYVDNERGKYYLTNKGLKVIGKVKEEKTPPSTHIPIDDYVKHAIALIEKYPAMSESNTISTLIDPLLEALKWNIRNPGEVQREYPIRIGKKTEYVDIALKIYDKPVVFIEVKSIDTNLNDHLAEQPIKYANAEGVSWCVLTNGHELRVYNAFWKIKGIEQKMFFKLSIEEFKEKMDKLELLSKEAVTSGRLDDEGELEHAKRTILEWLKQMENFVVKSVEELDPSLKEEYVRRILRGLTFE